MAVQIIERILCRAKMCTLTSKELNILERVLQVTPEVRSGWLVEFLDCIPHSNFDEIYAVFDLLVLRGVRLLDKPTISLIIATLLNQYTVKGKAHQESKERFITNLIRQLPGSLQLLLEICFLDNIEPTMGNYLSRSRKDNRERDFDSKQYKL